MEEVAAEGGLPALAEALIAPIPLPAWAQVVDSRLPPPPVYDWLAAKPGALVVAELPMLDIRGIFEHPAHHESIYLVQSTRGHWKTLANGYAGIEPTPYVALRNAVRHGRATQAIVKVGTRASHIYLLVRDNGSGFVKGNERVDDDGFLDHGAELRPTTYGINLCALCSSGFASSVPT